MKTYRKPPPAFSMRMLAATAMLALAGGAVQTVHAAPGGPGMMAGPGMDMGMGGGPGMGGYGMGGHGMAMAHAGHMGRLLDAVGASADQKAQIKQIMDAVRTDLKPVHTQMKTLREQSASVFTKPNVDAAEAERLRGQMSALHEQASKRVTLAMVESSRVLTPEQRQKMADLMSKRRDMAERHRAENDALMGVPARK